MRIAVSFNILLSVAKAPAWARSTQDQDGPPDDPQTYANFLTFLLSRSAASIRRDRNLERAKSDPRMDAAGCRSAARATCSYLTPAYSDPRLFAVDADRHCRACADRRRTPARSMTAPSCGRCTLPGWAITTTLPLVFTPIAGRTRRMRPAAGQPGWDDNPHFFFADNISDYRQMMVNNGQSDLQMWVTEFGWATWEGFPGQPPAGSEWMLRNTKWDQANYTIRAFQIGQQTPYIGPMILWNLEFCDACRIDREQRRAHCLQHCRAGSERE